MYMARMGYSETIRPGNRDSDTTQKDNDAFLQLSIVRFKGWDYEQLKSSVRTRTTRKSPGCAVEHRVIDWASRSPSQGSSK
jgi:hypothetical protein